MDFSSTHGSTSFVENNADLQDFHPKELVGLLIVMQIFHRTELIGLLTVMQIFHTAELFGFVDSIL